MNLFLRLLWLVMTSRFRPAVPAAGPARTPFRVLPSDLDVLMHVNNGVYLSMMDLARVDLMRRAGLFREMTSRGWYPVVVAQTIQYRRSLRLLERFDIVTRLLGWDDKALLVEQRFERKGEVVAYALVRARFLSRAGGPVAVAELLAAAGNPPAPADVPEFALRWNAEQSRWHGGTPAAASA